MDCTFLRRWPCMMTPAHRARGSLVLILAAGTFPVEGKARTVKVIACGDQAGRNPPFYSPP